MNTKNIKSFTLTRKTRRVITAATAIILAISLYGCSSPVAATADTASTKAAQSTTTAAPATSETSTTVATEKSFTLDELATYDGQNGNPAYIAVDGVVYDVSAIRAWKDGIHQGKYKAGLDYTDLIKKSPHGTKVLDKAVRVGVLSA